MPDGRQTPEACCRICGSAEVALWLRKQGFPVYSCRACENAFVPDAAVPAALESLYTPSYFLSYFTAAGLARFVACHGFSGPVRVKRFGRWVSLANVAFKLSHHAPSSTLRRLADGVLPPRAQGRRLRELRRRDAPRGLPLPYGGAVTAGEAKRTAAHGGQSSR